MTTVAVGDERLRARHVVIATGARPVPLSLPGAEHVVTSDQFLDLDRLPEGVLLIGGGYVSFEFAHIAARADARVVSSNGASGRSRRSIRTWWRGSSSGRARPA